MVSTKNGTKIVVGFAIIAILGATMLPVVLNNFNGPTEVVKTQDNGTTTEIGIVNSTVTNVDDVGNTATIELNDTETSTAPISKQIDNGTSVTYSLDKGDWNVTLQNIVDADTVEVKYEYPQDYSWGNGTSALYFLMPIFFLLVIILYFTGKATNFL